MGIADERYAIWQRIEKEKANRVLDLLIRAEDIIIVASESGGDGVIAWDRLTEPLSQVIKYLAIMAS